MKNEDLLFDIFDEEDGNDPYSLFSEDHEKQIEHPQSAEELKEVFNFSITETVCPKLDAFQKDVYAWSQYNFGDQGYNRPFKGVVEEVGELSHALLKLEQNIRGTKEDHFVEACDAVGDIMIYLADFCARAGINMEEAVIDAWMQVRQRDWKHYPKNGKDE